MGGVGGRGGIVAGVRGRGAVPCPIPPLAVGLMCTYTGRAAYMLGLCLQGRFSREERNLGQLPPRSKPPPLPATGRAGVEQRDISASE